MAGGGLLKFSDTIEYFHPQSGTVSETMLDVLHFKHPNPGVPPASILPSRDDLPYLENVEITSAHVLSIV